AESRFRDDEIDISGFEVAKRRCLIRANELKHNSRVARRKEIDHGRNNAGKFRVGAPDTNHSHGRVGNELDLFDPPLEVVKDGDATLEGGAAIVGQADAAQVSVQQARTERAFQACNRLGNDRLRYVETIGCLSHAAGVDHLQQYVQVA